MNKIIAERLRMWCDSVRSWLFVIFSLLWNFFLRTNTLIDRNPIHDICLKCILWKYFSNKNILPNVLIQLAIVFSSRVKMNESTAAENESAPVKKQQFRAWIRDWSCKQSFVLFSSTCTYRQTETSIRVTLSRIVLLPF